MKTSPTKTKRPPLLFFPQTSALVSGPSRLDPGYVLFQPNALPFREAWLLRRFLLRTGRSRLNTVSWSLSSSDSDIIKLELCSVLRCLISAERQTQDEGSRLFSTRHHQRLTEFGPELHSLLFVHVVQNGVFGLPPHFALSLPEKKSFLSLELSITV